MSQPHPRDRGSAADEETPPQPRALPPPEKTEEERRRALRDSFWQWGRVLFIVAAAYFAVQLLAMIGGVVSAVLTVLLYVVFGGIIALIVAPFNRLFRRALPAPLAALLSLIVLVGVIALLVYEVGAPVAGQAHALSAALPRLERPFIDLQHTLAQHGINVSLGAVASVLGIQVSGATSGTVLLNVVSFTAKLLIDFLITLVAAFWLLCDGEGLRRGVLNVLPGRWRTETDFVLNAFMVVFGGYLRGQVLLAGVVGVLAGVGCFLLGVPFPLVVGVAAGVFELIPLAGPFVGAGIGAIFALTVSPALTFETLGLFLFIHIIEGYVISPRIQGRFVRLHPLVTLLALLTGVAAGGFLGAFFAVPLASVVALIARVGIADLRAAQPDMYMISDSAIEARGRRRRLLAQYRVHPGAATRRVARRIGRLLHRMRARTVLPLLLALGAIAALLVYANPGRIGLAFARFNLLYLPIVVALAVGFYVVQGIRWWTLNRALRIRFPLKDTVFLTVAGQATALLPLGELTRALLVSRAASVSLGAVVATETVQELLFVFMLFVVALPTALSFHFVAVAVIVPLIFIAAIVAVLTNEALYSDVRRVVDRIPLLKRIRPTVDELHRDTRVLFRQRATYVWLPLSVAQALIAVSLLWFIAQAVDPGHLAWTSAGFVYAVTQGASWLTFSPGGLGALEASTAGLLVALGFSFDIATAVALLQRCADKVLNGAIGWACYGLARRRYNLRLSSLLNFKLTSVAAAERRPATV